MNILNVIYKIGIVTVLVFLVLLIASLIYFEGIKSTSISQPVGTVLGILVVVTIASAIILWVDAWFFIARSWRLRRAELNYLYVIVMLVAWWVAAYYFHYLKAKSAERVG